MSETKILAPGIRVDHAIAFGRPRMRGYGITTATIWSRYRAGEFPDEIADDYGMPGSVVMRAIAFEAGRAWADHGRKEWNRE